ncbi:MAG: transposase [Trueperaceae bacterium]|nr:transposase [Trueperaceae bacterium]MDZ7705722.1 transposase [Trueperaceae bacterium]
MAGYSLDLRDRIVKAYCKEGQSQKAVAERFAVSRWTVARYVRKAKRGTLAPTPHPGRCRTLDHAQCEVLREQVAEHNDWTLAQHAEALAEKTGVSLKKSSIANYLRRLGITHKKRAATPQSATRLSDTPGARR